MFTSDRCYRHCGLNAIVGWELFFGKLCLTFELCYGFRIVTQVYPMLFLKVIHQEFADGIIDILAAQISVSIRSKNFKPSIWLYFHDGNVKRTSTEVEDQDRLFTCISLLLSVNTKSKGSCRWLIEESNAFQPRNLACVFCGISLHKVEICRHRDHTLIDVFVVKFVDDRLSDVFKNFGWYSFCSDSMFYLLLRILKDGPVTTIVHYFEGPHLLEFWDYRIVILNC